MEQANNQSEGYEVYETDGDMVAGNGQPLAGIKLDLNGKISRYLDSLNCSAWPMRVYYLTRSQEREEAEAWIKELIGKVLNA